LIVIAAVRETSGAIGITDHVEAARCECAKNIGETTKVGSDNTALYGPDAGIIRQGSYYAAALVMADRAVADVDSDSGQSDSRTTLVGTDRAVRHIQKPAGRTACILDKDPACRISINSAVVDIGCNATRTTVSCYRKVFVRSERAALYAERAVDLKDSSAFRVNNCACVLSELTVGNERGRTEIAHVDPTTGIGAVADELTVGNV